MNYDPLAEITMPDLSGALAKPEEAEPEAAPIDPEEIEEEGAELDVESISDKLSELYPEVEVEEPELVPPPEQQQLNSPTLVD